MFCFHLYYFCIFDDCKYFCLASKSPKKKPPKNENIELKQTIGKLIEKIILFLFLYFGFKQSNLNFLFKKKEQYIPVKMWKFVDGTWKDVFADLSLPGGQGNRISILG